LPRITTYTGSEWHSSYGAKGHVFVFNSRTKQETLIFTAPGIEKIDEEWTNVQEGTHGRWCESTWEVPNGAIIKVFSISTRKDVPYGGGSAYLIVDETQPEMIAVGDGYQGNAGSARGPLALIPFDEIESRLGIKIDPKHKKYFRDKVSLIPVTQEEEHAI
jgi:hypothetical protein